MDRLVRRRHAVPNALPHRDAHLPEPRLHGLGRDHGGDGVLLAGPRPAVLRALRGPDVALLQAIFLLFSIGVVLANLVADLLYAVIDPRVRS